LTNTFRMVFGWIFIIGGFILAAFVCLHAQEQLRPVQNTAENILGTIIRR
jgi:hypothetical protein